MVINLGEWPTYYLTKNLLQNENIHFHNQLLLFDL